MDNTPSKKLLKSLIAGPMAGVTAAVVGGVFSLGAAVLPSLLPAKPESPGSSPASQAAPDAISSSPASAAIASAPRLTYGTWTLLESVDDDGTDWRNSVLKFTSQKPTADGLEIEGFFEWRNGVTLIGREYVRGNYVVSTRNLYIEGQRVENIAGELALGSFSARLAEDDRNLVEGCWGDTAGNATGVPGTWRARR
jgi:hypothetical protein